ncbi:MAG: glycoside hydrolase family 3 C-terminal domain-containing protein [Clostridia bacterium]|nr:glycoside hydrolase family 3 C-terminal domain-containing protein [Clostridia bacterium]MDY5263908.1 glycoside hydrolase family 3 C-terminal domain-containing protein [Eubacteriales bacterium]
MDKLKSKLINIINVINDKSVAQKSNNVMGEKKPFGNMPALTRQVATEGAVLLENDGVLPLKNSDKVALLGRCQINYFYVGYGSGGDVNPPYLVNVKDGMQNHGINLDKNILDYYEKWTKKNKVVKGAWGLWPTCYDEAPLPSDLIDEATKTCDVCVVVIGRAAGEDRDNELAKGSYYLTDEERAMLSQAEKFNKTVVIVNSGNIIDLSWVKEYHVSALLYVWQGGSESGNAIADLLCGNVSPSGRLTDTIAYNYEDYPSSKNFGDKEFNVYEEDIFVGYKYFETFNKNAVLYPFGYGLSYSKFDFKDVEFSFIENEVTVRCKIKNVGNVKAKEVAQLYLSAPQGKLGKATRELVAFCKTGELEAGEEESVVLTANYDAFASFDDVGAVCKNAFVLEKGRYEFYLGKDVRSAVLVGNFDLKDDVILGKVTGISAVNEEFERVVAVEKDGELRLDYATVKAEENTLKQRILANIPKFTGKGGNYKWQNVVNGECSIDDFISGLSLDELEALTRGQGKMDSEYGVKGNAGAFGGITKKLREKGVPAVITTDGPSGIRVGYYTTLMPCGTAIACSFNEKLVEQLGEETGKEMRFRGTDVLLAPGMNLHRNHLCGRNFEYFSEDSFLTGKIAAAQIRGIQKSGLSACPKHFACNNQEQYRTTNNSVVSQRALRETYLKGFQIAVKEGKPNVIMTSYNKINGVWSHYNYDLATEVLRNEWGFDGVVITDWWMRKASSPEFPTVKDNAYRVRSGVDVLMPGGIKRLERSYKSDGTLLSGMDTPNGICKEEIIRSAKAVLLLILKLQKPSVD